MHFDLGWYSKIPDKPKAIDAVREIRLLSKAEIKKLFPDAEIHEEKFWGMAKSYVAYGSSSRLVVKEVELT